MAKNWGRTPVANADQRHATQIAYMVTSGEGSEERIDRRPQGKVERFVDDAGNVCSLQLYSMGDPKKLDAEQRNRAAYHRKNCVEHARCPIRSGTRGASAKTARDFAKMPAHLSTECQDEIRVMKKIGGVLYADKGCPHIEWLIQHRKKEAASAYEKRNEQLVRAEALAEAKRRAEVEQSKAIAVLLEERSARKPKKDNGE